MSSTKALNIANINPNIKKLADKVKYVKGPLTLRAIQLEQDIMDGAKKDFDTVIKANLGDARAMGNKSITFIRQLMAIVVYPPLLDNPDANIPNDVKDRARAILGGCRGGDVGSYSDSAGVEIIRKHIAEYISERDGGISADWHNIVLANGASGAIVDVLKMFNDGEGKTGVMIPLPEYPIYSATLIEFGIKQVFYELDESRNWSLDVEELYRAISEAKKECEVRAIVIINPGNPTGQVLTRDNIEDIIKFCYRERLFILADEVYQHNVYNRNSPFHSFKKVMTEMGTPYSNMELASFMSCSKGYMGECGVRGGYTELVNIDPEVMTVFHQSISAKLCPTVLGQACIDAVMNPPAPGEPSYPLWKQETDSTLASLARRAKIVTDALNSIEGITCNSVQGAMYALPNIELSEKVLASAVEASMDPDVFYCFRLLEATGISTIPGSGFGQKAGTYHFRMTILPKEDDILEAMDRIKRFHDNFTKEFQ